MQVETLELRRLLAVNLLTDVMGLSATESVTVNGTSYFFADDGATGRELWKSDGTIAGTQLVKDLTPGAVGSELYAIHQGADGRAVFVTVVHNPITNSHRTDDYTLWASDGTAGGTVKLREFKAAMGLLTRQLGDQVLIMHMTESPAVSQAEGSIYTDAHLYVTDGTAANTTLIRDFLATTASENVPPDNYMILSWYEGRDRVVFGGGDYPRLWSTDGTAAGTIDITTPDLADAGQQYQVDFSRMVQLDDGKVLIPSSLGAGKFWIADGTVAGTRTITANVQGVILPSPGQNTVVNGKYIFVELYGTPAVRSLDLETGQITTLRSAESGQSMSVYDAGSRILFTHDDLDASTGTLWSTDGTTAGTFKLADFQGLAPVHKPTVIGNTAFFVVATGPYVTDVPPVGWLGSDTALRAVTGAGASSVSLWRTDGTLANTGKVKTIWQGDVTGKVVTATLSAADGKLLLRTTVRSGVQEGVSPNPESLPIEFDDTSAYDGRELTFGREGASARLVNGILHVRGSYNDDRIRIWRSQRMPEKLIVEYNGNQRSFIFDSIARINVDLQDGNDYFQILEGEGQVIRLRTSILGGDGSDTIYGGTGRDTIYAGNSGDLIYGRGNADVILGGGGRDRLNAGVGDDQVSGGSGIDRIIAGTGVDVLFGQNAIEMAFGQDVEGEDWDEDVFLG